MLDFSEELRLAARIERDRARNHGEEDSAEAPDIDSGPVILLPQRHLGRGEGRGPAHGLEHLPRDHVIRKAEVRDLAHHRRPLLHHEDVLGLEVAMRDVLPVAEVHAAHDLGEPCPRLPFRYRPFCDNVLVELPPLCEVEHQINLRASLDHIVEGDDVGVSNVLEDMHLAHHPLQVLDVVDPVLVHDLYRKEELCREVCSELDF
mmetsp:Transcript_12440/g.30149  ORF Transcript_12440/g.30149 Transcript_12440/m.30149 type:complete len:204 (+) Transcript_12440:656-1267(+)